MIARIKEERFWFFKSLETYALAIYFIIKQNSGVLTPPPNSLLDTLDNPCFTFLLLVVATLTLAYSLLKHRNKLEKTIVTSSLTFFWLLYAVAFTYHAIELGMVDFSSIYSFFIILTIVGEIIFKG